MKTKKKSIPLFAFIITLLLSSCSVSTSKTAPEPIPDWNQYEVDNIIFQLPDTYKDDTEWYKENYPDESINTIFFATEQDEINKTIETVFFLSKFRVSKNLDFKEYIDGYVDLINSVYQVTEHFEMNSQYPTEKIISIGENEYSQNIYITNMVYIGEFMYRIEFQCKLATFEVYESQFETIYDHIQFPDTNYANLFGENHQGIVQLATILIMIFSLVIPARLKRRKKGNIVSSTEEYDPYKENK